MNNVEQQAPPIKRNIANISFRWPDVPMPLTYQVPMPIIDELFELGLVALEGDQKDTYTWAGKGTQLGAIKDEHFKDKGLKDSLRDCVKGFLLVPPDDPILHVIRPLVNSAESVKFEQTKGSRQQYGKTIPTLYTTIEIVNHGPTSEHPKSE